MLGLEAAVERFLEWRDDEPLPSVPDFSIRPSLFRMAAAADEPWLGMPPEIEQKPLVEPALKNYELETEVRAWWLERMLRTQNPLLEKMTLFWHGHFATSIAKVGDPLLMWTQNLTLRHHALGDFGALVKAISRDPAMMIYLDVERNGKNKPNENFARELMELFTLGIGNYSEEDIQQAARAFTGYRLKPVTRDFQFIEREHDHGQKFFMGWISDYEGDEIIDRILDRPACAQFICTKLWRFFASEDLDAGRIASLAQTLRENRYKLKPVLRELFTCPEFYSARALQSQIKSPVQFFVQTARSLGVEPSTAGTWQGQLRQLGQTLFAPPNVKGWDGGKTWISTQTLLLRYNCAEISLRPGNKSSREFVNIAVLAPKSVRTDPELLVNQLAFRLFQRSLDPKLLQTFLDFIEPHRGDLNDQIVRNLLQLMISTPQFQVG
ncbi:MAG: DUF1800 domain-containing protein [Verrucomicrobiota bacterium]|nr:DUF1800 domain-containing protein [Verrucomicrobiota bacterium]